MSRTVTILVIEDEDSWIATLKSCLSAISRNQRSYYGIDGFEFHVAQDGISATKLLSEAKESGSPYSLALVDLELPRDNGPKAKPEDKQLTEYLGMELLGPAIDDMTVLGAIVETRYEKYKETIRGFPGLDVGFINKDDIEKDLLPRVLDYFEREGMRILDRRAEILLDIAQKGLARRLGVCFSGFVQKVVDETEALKLGFSERWGLDVEPDTQDPHARRLIALDKAIEGARSEWHRIQSALGTPDLGLQKLPLERLLRELRSRFRPSLLLKNVDIERLELYTDQTSVQSFESDVQTVLTEIILGTLSSIPNHQPERSRIEVFMKTKGRYAEVQLLDNLEPLQKEDAEAINKGALLVYDPSMGRVWGLSLARFMAKRGGGELMVEPKSSGTLITYQIPRVTHG
jgi:CheY-like chemotaxis protein